MVELQRQRVEHEMSKLVDELDKSHLRRMQASMHRCAADCCDNGSSSLERVQQCVENCSKGLNSAQLYVQRELEGAQRRLQRCVMDCNDEIKDKMGPNPTDSEANKYTAMFESCATKCVDKHVQLIPSLLKTMKAVLAKGAPQQSPLA